ncbi:MAG: ABC-2 transporter permease [Bacillota bacterium]|uniref:ABC-2 transporter permease n=1 Tax=Virgibacillus salarius TaxID=447199 RepID=UPI0003F66745|nr:MULTISPECIES: ABC-2 transporter permease [Bacillaceae]WBX81041.1 ABC-2 transporter permease [Virgibacillus salarius]
MLNLIRKDILLQKNGILILLPALFIYLFFGTSITWVSIVFSIVIIMDVFSKDEKSSTNLLLNALPYTRNEIVSSKYIGAIILMTFVLLTISVGNWIIHSEMVQWKQLLLITSIVVIFISFAFPFCYLFKSRYLMNASIVLFCLYLVIVNTFIVDLNDRIRNIVHTILSLENTQLYLFVTLSVVLLYVISWILSIRIYRRKVF